MACVPGGDWRTVVVLRSERRRSRDRVRGEVGSRHAGGASGDDDEGGEHSAEPHVVDSKQMFVGLDEWTHNL